jgi:hypothetical protein
MKYTLTRQTSYAALASGRYQNIRLFNYGFARIGDAPASPAPAWTTSRGEPWSSFAWAAPTNETVDAFASTCWYYGETLIDILGEPDLPLGLLLSSVGGTTIEQWSRAAALQPCDGAHKNPSEFNLFNTMVAPLVNVSVSTLLWYQGENDLGAGAQPGNITNHSGYACALANTMRDWRSLRAQPALPVGVFGLAPGGSEGHSSEMAAFRAAQNSGAEWLGNSFFIPTHDLGDPCNKHSKSAACTGNGAYSYMCPKGRSCDVTTPFRDSRIHSRVKRLVGARAAHAASALLYGSPRPASGPVISGCHINKATGSIVVQFALAAELNVSTAAKWQFALDTPFLTGVPYTWSAFEARFVRKGKAVWVPVNASLVRGSVDCVALSSRTDPVFEATGVRYAWSEQPCCTAVKGGQNNGNCAPGSCPLWTVALGASANDRLLPALPFEAELWADGRCHCHSPQQCDGTGNRLVAARTAPAPLAPSQLLCELRREPAGVSCTSLLFSWAFPPSNWTVVGFQLTIRSSPAPSSATVIWSSGRVASTAASYQFSNASALRPATRYFWTVSYWYSDGETSKLATPRRFSTALDVWSADAIWLAQPAPDHIESIVRGKPDVIKQPTLAQFRAKTVQIGAGFDSALLFVAAGRTHKQLGSFKLFVNGHAIGMGPGRSAINAQQDDVTSAYDSYDLTDVSAAGTLTLAVQCFAAEHSGQLIVELHLLYANGTRVTVGSGSDWRVWNATASFGPIGTAGTQYYTQPHAFLDARLFAGSSGSVDEWAHPEFDDSSWDQAVAITSSQAYFRSAPLAPKPTPPLELLSGVVEILEELGPGHWTFRVPKEIQGGVRLHVTGASTGTTVIVRLGEEPTANGTSTPMFQMRTGNLFQEIWTLQEGSNVLQAHEYVEFSRGELILQPPSAHLCTKTGMSGSKLVPAYVQCPSVHGVVQKVTFAEYGQLSGTCWLNGSNTFRANKSCVVSAVTVFEALCVGRHRCEITPPAGMPEPCHGPKTVAVAVECNDTASAVHAANDTAWLPKVSLSSWIVRYPFNESDSHFTSSSAALNLVFAFSKYTIAATNLDMWTDSNTRQRDVNCNEANGIIGPMQSAVALEFASQRWTSRYILDSKHAESSFVEWRPISVGYVVHDVMATGNLSLAARYYGLMKAGNYTLEPWLDQRVGLVNVSSLPAAEIDWPSNMRDCYVSSDYSTIVNAYVARANAQMAQIAGWLGKHDEAASFAATATGIRAALNRHSWDPLHSRFCDGVCAPAMLEAASLQKKIPSSAAAWTNHSAWHTQVFMLAFDLVDGDTQRKATFESIKSRLFGHGSTPAKCSQPPSAHPQGKWPAPDDGMPGNVYAANFALQALFSFEPDHGSTALALLNSDRKNTWLGQIKSGATTTKEAWGSEEKPNLTWSHPWGASPAAMIPIFLLGLVATQPGFASVKIQPQLGNLTQAAGKVPTVRGPIEIAVSQPGGDPLRMKLHVILPGGVLAELRLPATSHAAEQSPAGAPTMCVNGVATAATRYGHTISVTGLRGAVSASFNCE